VNDPRWAHRELQEGEMAIVQITPDTIAAYWNGTLCDDRLVLTVSGDRSSDPPDRLELRGESADRVASHSSTTGWCSSSVSRSTPHRCKARNE
jgi:hypothetical protein